MCRNATSILSTLTVGAMVWLIPKVGAGCEEPPPWLGNKAGISDELLAPWTAVVVKDTTVSVWGRDDSFGPLPRPAGVTTAGASIVAGPGWSSR